MQVLGFILTLCCFATTSTVFGMSTNDLYSMLNENLDKLSQTTAQCGCPSIIDNINLPESVRGHQKVLPGILHNGAEDSYESFMKMLKDCDCAKHDPGAVNSLKHIYRFDANQNTVAIDDQEVKADVGKLYGFMEGAVKKC
eukprot:PhF_6_TR8990/c0_g1_i1/m.14118